MPLRFRVETWSAPLGLVAPLFALAAALAGGATARGEVERRLYVAVPGIRNYLEYGGHGLLVLGSDNHWNKNSG